MGHALLRRKRFDVVVVYRIGDEFDGLAVTDWVAGIEDRPKVVFVSDKPSADWVRLAFKRGAFDVLTSAHAYEELVATVANAFAQRAVERGCSDVSRGVEAAIPLIDRIDSVTGLAGRSEFATAVGRLGWEVGELGRPVSVLVVDIDGFRNVVERVSRRAGDDVLRALADFLRGRLSFSDCIGVNKPDQFFLGIAGATEAEAVTLANRLRADLADGPLPHFEHERIRVSIGVASKPAGWCDSPKDLVEQALAALRQAKRDGGNQTLAWSFLHAQVPSRQQLAEASVHEVSNWLQLSKQQLRRGYLESTHALIAAVEAKEPMTRAHAQVVSRYCEEIARRMELPAAQIRAVKTAGLLHDIGKIGVPDAILQKPGALTPSEFEIIKHHPATAVNILQHASFLQAEIPMILHHHERFDGGGYPAGLAGDAIPLGARIVCVGDALDAMHSARSYKAGFGLDYIRAELKRCAGSHFDPEVAEVTADWIDSHPEAFTPCTV